MTLIIMFHALGLCWGDVNELRSGSINRIDLMPFLRFDSSCYIIISGFVPSIAPARPYFVFIFSSVFLSLYGAVSFFVQLYAYNLLHS